MTETLQYNANLLFSGELMPGDAPYLLDEAPCFLSITLLC